MEAVIMSMNVRANAERLADRDLASGERGATSVVYGEHANDQMIPPVLELPARVALQVTRLDVGSDSIDVEGCEDSFTLLFAVEGEAAVRAEGTNENLTPLRAVMIGRGPCRIEGRDVSRVMILRLPHRPVQICASARYGGARRIARSMLPVDLGRSGGLHRGLRALAICDDDREAGRDLLEAVIAALAEQHGAELAFPSSRSITLARTLLDQSADVFISQEELAGKAGVTGITLQRGFKAILGMTVARYSQAVRLHRAQARLQCDGECRSIAEIAESVGFPSATSFTRAYQKLFDETPTQTRTRVFRMSDAKHFHFM